MVLLIIIGIPLGLLVIILIGFFIFHIYLLIA